MSNAEGWVFKGTPRDVVAALMQRAWDDDTTDDRPSVGMIILRRTGGL